jgi:hypothetical protein
MEYIELGQCPAPPDPYFLTYPLPWGPPAIDGPCTILELEPMPGGEWRIYEISEEK